MTNQVVTSLSITDPTVLKRTYILHYHFRAASPLSLIFEFTGTFHEAIARGRTHCDRMGYRFIKVRPFIVDLEEREKRVLDGENVDNL